MTFQHTQYSTSISKHLVLNSQPSHCLFYVKDLCLMIFKICSMLIWISQCNFIAFNPNQENKFHLMASIFGRCEYAIMWFGSKLEYLSVGSLLLILDAVKNVYIPHCIAFRWMSESYFQIFCNGFQFWIISQRPRISVLPNEFENQFIDGLAKVSIYSDIMNQIEIKMKFLNQLISNADRNNNNPIMDCVYWCFKFIDIHRRWIKWLIIIIVSFKTMHHG